MRRVLVSCLSLVVLSVTPQAASHRAVRLATSSSLTASGLIEAIAPAFQRATGYRLEVYAVGTGQALRMGRLGQADVVIAHAPMIEHTFIAEGYADARLPLMHNVFLLVGPPSDPAGVRGMTDAAAAFDRIFTTQSPFVSRADNSGNHKKELSIWNAAQRVPVGAWYFETGETMLASLMIAHDQQAYILIDSGVWLTNQAKTSLVAMVQGDARLKNSYSLLLSSTDKHPQVNDEGARQFADWLQSAEGHRTILSIRIAGEPLYKLGH
jgi:tungstate transport system substrate-binding protein